jgi:GT2 family glycosyltransferase
MRSLCWEPQCSIFIKGEPCIMKPSGRLETERARESATYTSPVLSILMVSYNSRDVLSECLPSIGRNISMPFEVVLVDNNSTDGTAQYIREFHPWVRLIQSSANLGFSGGNNRAAREAKGMYFLLLNCDTILLTDVADGISILDKDHHVGIVGARMYGPHGQIRPSTAHFPSPWRLWKFSWQWSKPLARPYGPPDLSAFRHDWVEASLLLTTRENWFAVGGMDENGFMYGEDVELCANTAQQGRLTVLCAKLMYIHLGGYTVDRMTHGYAGYRRFHASCSDPFTRWRADTVLLAGLVPRLIVYGFLAALTGRKTLLHKYKQFWRVLRHWNETSPRPSTRLPVSSSSTCDN